MVQVISFLLLLVFSPSAFSLAGWCPSVGADVPSNLCNVLRGGGANTCESTSSANLQARVRASGYTNAVCTGPLDATGYCSHSTSGTAYYRACTVADSAVCTPPQVLDSGTNTCVTPVVCTAGEEASAGYYDVGTDSNGTNGLGIPMQTACDNSCFTNYEGNSVAFTSLVGGVVHYFSQGAYVKSGASCSTGPSSPIAVLTGMSPICTPPQILNIAGDACISDPNPASVCPSPTIKIGFNADGSPICHSPSGGAGATASCPAGQTFAAGVCVNNSNPCLATGSCTAADSSGSAPGVYPYVPNSGSTGGSGTSTSTSTPSINASGVTTTTTVECAAGATTAGCADMTIGTGDESIGTRSIDLGAMRFDGFLWSQGGACPSPRQVSVLGQSFAISYQPACTFMIYFSYVATAVAVFIGGLIVFGARSQEA